MDNLYIYLVKMPPGINESVEPCLDGYTIYLNQNLMGEDLIRAYEHALYHIEQGDCWNETMTTAEIEQRAHNRKEMMNRYTL